MSRNRGQGNTPYEKMMAGASGADYANSVKTNDAAKAAPVQRAPADEEVQEKVKPAVTAAKPFTRPLAMQPELAVQSSGDVVLKNLKRGTTVIMNSVDAYKLARRYPNEFKVL
jgi:predicted methyltransferase MtxX (methanogen marker protein 4)